jgi:hypothetical protein
MVRDVVGEADQGNGRTGWKKGEDLSFTEGQYVFYASHARRTALGFQD